MTSKRIKTGAARQALSLRKRLVFSGVLLVFALLAMEAFSRVYWWTQLQDKGRSFLDPDIILHALYPELQMHRLQHARTRSDGTFDVLLLGASVLKENWTDVYQVLREELSKRFGDKCVIHNIARSGQMSLDSLHKYTLLDKHRFDLVLVYHSINEIRANDCRTEIYRDDYSQMAWFANANFAMKHRALCRVATFPMTLHKIGLVLAHYAGLREFIPLLYVNEDHRAYGSVIKTPAAYEKNIRSIIAIAREREDPLLLMTYAYYIPKNYTAAKFAAGELDYFQSARQAVPVEFWGLPENVSRTLDAHNEVIRRLEEETKPAYYIDMANKIPKEGRYWGDVCHLSPEGSRLFVDTILKEVLS